MRPLRSVRVGLRSMMVRLRSRQIEAPSSDGKEAIHSNKAIVDIIHGALGPSLAAAVQLVESTDRALVPMLLKPFFLTPEGGARTSLYLAGDTAAAAYNGEYFDKCRPIPPKANALDDAAAERLWTLSEQLIAQKLRA